MQSILSNLYMADLVSSAIFDVPRTRTVIPDEEDPNSRLVLLNFKAEGMCGLRLGDLHSDPRIQGR